MRKTVSNQLSRSNVINLNDRLEFKVDKCRGFLEQLQQDQKPVCVNSKLKRFNSFLKEIIEDRS